ncbi:putative translation elongation factor G [uncultured Eubacteriales bacterium]|uniref:Putative translation elongation factor G n=1 Tax=uncultured Eubacteriales bacterium TaxID=172733 RepID=A0A212JJN4_9FIRM|nr:putative translation elongation factor G [uncultured Eubacteriales bacterium]
MRKLAVGILAHVDAGKTTLSEGLLYTCGCLRTLGRVDHQNAFLDTEAIERERGITVFSKQAILPLEDLEITLLDTPGHVDFSTEMERTLGVLDCAVLVVSGPDGVRGHTLTLWNLLEEYGVPTFLFVNKMDLAGADRDALLTQFRDRLGDGCVDFGAGAEHIWESAALCGEALLTRYLERGRLEDEDLAALVEGRRLFPCYFGSALRLEGVEALLDGLRRFAPSPTHGAEFGARVYKIARDAQGERLTYLKITGGTLRVKDLLTNRRAGLGEDEAWEEKADQIRLYSGAKYRTADEVGAGTVCAVTGLSRTYPGQGLGWERDWRRSVLEPVLTYRVLLPDGYDPHAALLKLNQLQEEDPQLHLVWNTQTREICLQLMGEVQLEVLKELIARRFGLAVEFDAGSIVYRETIAAPSVGIGHFEPLRHYAEVHLLLEPGERGSGLRIGSDCPEGVLDRGWQRLILSHLAEKAHLGVLTGSPITDLTITLIAGRGHEKHTEGGDFRQATYRAVRQGLMRAESVLLEPFYDFRLEVPQASLGRAISDLQRMGGEIAPPETAGENAVLTGSAPVSSMRDYARQVTAYTAGQGRLFCVSGGYRPCADQAAAVASLGYDPERDLENTPDSVFCAHGAGFTVKWDKVEEYAHVSSGLAPDSAPEQEEPDAPAARPRPVSYAGAAAEDKELQAIFERTYGPVKRREFMPGSPARELAETVQYKAPAIPDGQEYLLVDGYNLIFAWDELKAAARDSLDAARQLLLDLLSNYQGFQKNEVIVVFDAYRVPRSTRDESRYHNIHVVFTKEAETADAYIEKVTYDLGKKHRVRVATSDYAEQLIILGHGALRLSASSFREEVERVSGQISALLRQNNLAGRSQPVRAAMEKAMENGNQ